MTKEKDEFEKAREWLVCNFCQNTGKHLCPDIVQPVEIACSKKGCVYGENESLKAKLAKAEADNKIMLEALEFIESKTYSDPLGIEELNCRAARVYERAKQALEKIGEK